MPKKYTHIFFDLDNTIWDFEKNSFFAMQLTFNQFIKNKDIHFDDFFAVYSKHNKLLWEEYRNQRIVKKELKQKRFKLTFEEFNIQQVDPEQMNDFYLSEMPKQKHLNAGVPDLLKYLKQKRYDLNIITNGFSEVQFKKLETSGISSYFSKVFISEIVKTPKPGKEIFEYAVKSCNAKKSKCIMIGDDWEVDIMGSYKYGIDSIYFYKQGSIATSKKLLENGDKNLIYYIDNLAEVKNIL